MKRIRNKTYLDKYAERKFSHELKRKSKKYDRFTTVNEKENKKRQSKRLCPPTNFSLISNPNSTLKFFNDFMSSIQKVELVIIDMKYVEEMSIEVLLYIISLDKINRNNGYKTPVIIKSPSKKELQLLLAQSGLSKYFRANNNTHLVHEEIFSIRDRETNRENNIEDESTCKDAIDFALKFYTGAKFTDVNFRHMFNALAEMMTNTDNHAYDEDGELRNWYLFAIKVDKGIAFYFFDNGRGVIKTAKKNLLEEALNYTPFSYGHKSIMRAVLNGEYRSVTGDRNRNKGLPEINSFLNEDTVSLPIIITNKVYCAPQNDIYEINSHNFKGTLFVWLFNNKE